MENVGEYGGLILDQIRKIEAVSQGYTYFRDGDVVVAKITPCFENGKGALASNLYNGIAFGTTELHVMRPTARLHGKFLFYLSISSTFRQLGEAEMYGAGGQKRVPEEFIQNFAHPIPPFQEQTAIANFLDHETAKIDTLIAKQQRLIELLQEKRQALISHAVTKGLYPDAPMKDSEIEWIGETPIHWEVYALGKVSRLQRGHDLPDSLRNEGTYPIVTSSGVSAFHSEFKAHAPGVVTGRYGTIGKMYYIEEDYWPLNTALYVIDFFGNHPKFIYYMLMTLPFDMHSDKSAVPGVNRNDLHRLAVTVPAIEEQIRIVEFIDQALRQLDKLVDKAIKVIDILQERRSSLISAAVTGKIDVRGLI